MDTGGVPHFIGLSPGQWYWSSPSLLTLLFFDFSNFLSPDLSPFGLCTCHTADYQAVIRTLIVSACSETFSTQMYLQTAHNAMLLLRIPRRDTCLIAEAAHCISGADYTSISFAKDGGNGRESGNHSVCKEDSRNLENTF